METSGEQTALNLAEKFLVVETVKKRTDAEYKKYKEEAEAFLADKRYEDGTTGVEMPAFDGLAEYRYARTRSKKVVEFQLCDGDDLDTWVCENVYIATLFIKDNAEEFGKWCQDNYGEIPDGISRVQYDVPAGYGAPKFYINKADEEKVIEKVREILSGGGSQLDGMGALLLVEGEE